jgi:hypothetical protein
MRSISYPISIGLFLLLLSFRSPESTSSLNLLTAIQQKSVIADIHGNAKSTHYYEPVKMDISNNTGKELTIQIANGDLFVPADSDEQNLVVTEENIFTLLPNEKKQITVKAMCTEPNDAAGSETSTYTLHPNSNKQLKDVAAFIQSKKYFTACGQNAIWNIVEDAPIRDIYGADSIEEKNLRSFVSQLSGRPMPKLEEINNYENNYHAEPPKEKVGGSFEFDMAKARDVQIAMFNKNGVLVRELYNQKQVAPGPHKFNFEFDSSVYTEDEYYFKLIADNEIRITQKWNVKTIRDDFQQKIENRN